jgi:hypothetical protein
MLLAVPERAAWKRTLYPFFVPQPSSLPALCRDVSQRVAQTLQRVTTQDWLLDIALDHLTLGRAALYAAILEDFSLDRCQASLKHAVDGLRRSGNMDELRRDEELADANAAILSL